MSEIRCTDCKGLLGDPQHAMDFWCECTVEEKIDAFKKRYPEGLKMGVSNPIKVGYKLPDHDLVEVNLVSTLEDKSKLSVQIRSKIGSPNEIKELWGWMKKAEVMEKSIELFELEAKANKSGLNNSFRVNELEKWLVTLAEVATISHLIPPELMEKVLEIKKRQL